MCKVNLLRYKTTLSTLMSNNFAYLYVENNFKWPLVDTARL